MAGIISGDTNEVFLERLKKMTDIISHRGPDAQGHWISENRNVALGHRRLSIIDLSKNANQPMHYINRYAIVFNGEIYNYLEIRKTLADEGYKFTTDSDTEVLVALYDKEKEKCLQMLDGMFAFVIYDKELNEIFAARDRFGEKPFYYNYEPNEHFVFGSEMKCLWAAGIRKEINNNMLFSYLSYKRVSNENDESETFYKNCKNLPHRHFLKLQVSTLTLTIKNYYDIDRTNINKAITQEDASAKFRELFYTSVKRRLRSDVTVGSSLSGGLDSSAIVFVIDELKRGVALGQNTFSAIFPGFNKDEEKYINIVVNRTNVNPHFVTPNYKGMIADFEKLFWHQEEPFSTASIYAQYCVMRMAKENNVTVLLDGQGADEYLAGYHGYFQPYFNGLATQYPLQARPQYKSFLEVHKQNDINKIMRKDFKYYIRYKSPRILKIFKKYSNYYRQKKTLFFSKDFFEESIKNNPIPYHYFKNLNSALYYDILKGEIQWLLRYCDRNSMAHSIEVRLPFLYHELVEFVFSLPPYFKINDGWTKWIMRAAFNNVIPETIIWRRDKIGYEPPQHAWLQNKIVQEKVHENKRKLYEHHVISRKEFERSLNWKDSVSDINKSWDFLVTGEMFR